MGFLNSKKAIRLHVLDREIKELKDKLFTYKNSAEYNSLSSNLQSFLEKEDRDQKNKTHKNDSRDAEDYKSGMIFGWQKAMMTTTIPVAPAMADATNTYPANSVAGINQSNYIQPRPPLTPRGNPQEHRGYPGP